MTDRTSSWKCSIGTGNILLDRFLREQLTGCSWNQCRKLIAGGKVSINGVTARLPTALVQSGDEVRLDSGKSAAESTRRRSSILVHVDSQLVVANKPAGISTVPYDDAERDTLWHEVRSELRARFYGSRTQVLVVHRIDKETSGLVVFARTNTAFRHLKQLFRVHAIERRYLALVHGRITDRTIKSRLVADRGDGRRGSTNNPHLGRESITHVRVLEQFESTTLVECRLETGRTHQIRIHLSEAGHPLLGERVYAQRSAPEGIASRVMLHARDLGFEHPTNAQHCQWSAEPPEDMLHIISVLRGTR